MVFFPSFHNPVPPSPGTEDYILLQLVGTSVHRLLCNLCIYYALMHITIYSFIHSFIQLYIFFNLFILLFILFLVALGLCCCARAFLWLRAAGATLHCGAWDLGMRPSVVVARRLSSCGSRALERRLSSWGHGLNCSMACGIFPDQGLNLCLLHWQADS